MEGWLVHTTEKGAGYKPKLVVTYTEPEVEVGGLSTSMAAKMMGVGAL